MKDLGKTGNIAGVVPQKAISKEQTNSLTAANETAWMPHNCRGRPLWHEANQVHGPQVRPGCWILQRAAFHWTKHMSFALSDFTEDGSLIQWRKKTKLTSNLVDISSIKFHSNHNIFFLFSTASLSSRCFYLPIVESLEIKLFVRNLKRVTAA